MPEAKTGPEAASPPDPLTLLRSRAYLVLLVMAALIGVPVSAAAFGFLALVGELQPKIYTDLPKSLGFDGTPPWWPLPLLAVGGLLAGLTVQYLPGHGGHEPTAGFKARGAPTPIELPGIFFAALATLASQLSSDPSPLSWRSAAGLPPAPSAWSSGTPRSR